MSKNVLEIYSINIYNIDNTYLKDHYHSNEYQLFYLVEGEATYTYNGKEILLTKGQALLVKPGVPHGRTKCKTCKILDVKFGLFDDVLGRLINERIIVIDKNLDTVNMFFSLIVDAIESKAQPPRVVALSLELLLRCVLQEEKDQCVWQGRSAAEIMYDLDINFDDLSPCVQRSLQFITGFVALPAEPFSVEALARQVGYDKQYLSRAFKADIGISITQYFGILRINKAKELLENTDLKIFDMSRILGYSHPSHFMKNFKKYAGISPSKYREQWEKRR